MFVKYGFPFKQTPIDGLWFYAYVNQHSRNEWIGVFNIQTNICLQKSGGEENGLGWDFHS